MLYGLNKFTLQGTSLLIIYLYVHIFIYLSVIWCFARCFDSNLVEIPVEIESPDHHYYHVWTHISAAFSCLFISVVIRLDVFFQLFVCYLDTACFLHYKGC